MIFTGKALVVDDEPHVRKYVSLILRSLGASSVIEAENGAEGFAAYQRERPDLVLLDVNMPHLSGFEFCRSLREAGYEMELTLRLEIGLRPHAGDDETENGNATLDLTEEDLQVLQRMKIRIDPER